MIDRTGRVGAEDLAWVSVRLDEALAELGAVGELRVAVIADAEMADAHERHSGVAGTTDVLTFDLGEPGGPLDVDVLVCVDEAERRAAELGHPARHELLLYGVHAALHCLGHDDKRPDAADAMHAEEDRVLRAIGVGAIFSASPAGEGAS